MPWSDKPTLTISVYKIVTSAEFSICVAASPSTGKSFTIKRLVARPLENAIAPDRILPVTFARIAAKNLTPFELIVDDITLGFFWENITKKIYKNNFEKIKKHSEENVFLYESISSEEALKIATVADKKTNEPRIRYTIDFSNRLYRFQKYGDLNSFGLEILNLHTALEKLRKIS